MKNQQIDVFKGVAFVYDKLKLVITFPAGTMLTTRENLDIKMETSFLSGGPHVAFPCDALEVVYQNLEAIQTSLGKPNKEFAVVFNVYDTNTEEEVTDIKEAFKKEYNPLEKYINEGYEMRPLPWVYHNIEKYALDANKLEELNILTVDNKDFELEALIDRSKRVFDSILEEAIPNILRKSRVVDHVFVANEFDLDMEDEELVEYIIENNARVYIPFVCYNYEEELNGLVFANRYQNTIEADYDLDDIDCGNADLTYGNSIGYLVEANDGKLSIKMANYASYSTSGQSLVTVIEDMGYFEEIMKEDIKGFMIDLEYRANRTKLVKEAKELILEFEEIINNIGFSLLRDVSINEELATVIATDPNDNVLELELDEVASVYRRFIDGCGPCGGIFEEEIGLRICDIEYDYKKKNKDEFISYVGNLYYAKYRCKEIYHRLEDIECEA